MWLQQIFIASLAVCLIFQNVAAVVNNGQTKKTDDSVKPSTKIEDSDKTTSTVEDLIAESSEQANRREGAPDSNGHFNLPKPVYGVPNAPSNNVIYPAPPPDIPPPPSKPPPSSLYGTPTFGKTYGVPQINPLPPLSKGYSLPSPKYNFPSFPSNQFSTNLIPPKPIYGPPKNTYGPPGKPFKYPKYPSKGFGTRPAKPVYGPPLNFKNNFSYNKLNINNNNFNTNSLGGLYKNSLFSNNAYPSLYSGISSLNHQYGAPIIPPKKTGFPQYGAPNTISSTQYDISIKQPVAAYGPPQPSSNPKPPHPGAPAPPTPPDIKYDGWQPIPGLVSKKPNEEINHATGQGSGYHGLPLPSQNIGNDQLGNTYGAPPITIDFSYGNSLLDQPTLSNSYEVHINSVTGSKTGISDSYSAPLGTVTGSGGIVESSGAEAHGGSAAISQADAHSNSQSLNSDLSAVGIDYGSNIQATKSVEYEISPHGILDSNTGSSLKLSNSHYAPQVSSSSLGGTYGSKYSYNDIGSFAHGSKNSFSLHGHKRPPLFAPAKGLVPSNYGVPPSGQFGTPLYSNNYGNSLPSKRPVLYREPIQHGLFQNIAKESYNKDIHSLGGSSNSLYSPPPPAEPSISYGTPSDTGAISFQNVVHGSSTAGLDLHQNSFNVDGAESLLLNTYNTPLESTDDIYQHASSGKVINVALDYSHPSQTIDLTQGKHSSFSHNCVINNQQHQVTDIIAPQPLVSQASQNYGLQDLTYSPSTKSEAKVNSIEANEETHGKNYGKSVAESFGPNSELLESQSIDLNNISLQGSQGSYTLQIQSADGAGGQVPHTQVLNDGLLQSILQAIEQPGKDGQNNKYPIILQPSIERNNYSVNETINHTDESQPQASEIKEVIVEAPKNTRINDEIVNQKNEETLQTLDTSNIALYYKRDDDVKNVNTDAKGNSDEITQ